MITTLTLNPAIDVHVTLPSFRSEHENLAENVSRDIGGKGINISRALTENGIANLALIVLGEQNGREFENGLRETGVVYQAITCPGSIRENITIHPADAKETRLSFKGFTCSKALLDEIEPLIDCSGIVTFTGSLPGGIGGEDAEAFLMRLKERGAKLVIDSKSVSLEMLRRIGPWLIKPNAEEIEAYFGCKMTEARIREAAMELHRGGIDNAMISLGTDGALLASGGRLYRQRVPDVRVLSTIGAGDSSIAGFLAAYAKGGDAADCLRAAGAYGTAACLREGTNPPLAEDIERYYKAVDITEETV